MNEVLICFSLQSTSAELKNGEKSNFCMAAITGAHQVLITKGVPLRAPLKHIIPVSFWRHEENKSEMQQISVYRMLNCFKRSVSCVKYGCQQLSKYQLSVSAL